MNFALTNAKCIPCYELGFSMITLNPNFNLNSTHNLHVTINMINLKLKPNPALTISLDL